MEREKSCAILKIVFEICSGLFMILAVTCLGGKMFDLPIVILISILIASVTFMVVRTDKKILEADMNDSQAGNSLY